jgi:hypothetical protein
MAVAQPDLVEVGFMCNYLGRIVELSDRDFKVKIEPALYEMMIEKLKDESTLSNMTQSSAINLIKAAAVIKNEELYDTALKVFVRD